MIKKSGIIITVLFLSISSFSQKRFAENDSLYIWALNGLNLRETPDLNSKIIKTIQYGEFIIVDSIYESKIFDVELIKQIKVQNVNDNMFSEERKSYNYSVKGQMIKVQYKGIKGYVYSGLLSRLKPVNNLIYLYTLNDYFEKEYGVLTKFKNKDELRNFDHIIYKNGVNYYLYNGPGYFDTTYTLFNISFNECMLLVYTFIERTNNIVDKNTNWNGKWYIDSISEENISFSEESGMYHASVSKISNLISITVSGSN